MQTPVEILNAESREQLITRVIRAELERDNALHYARELSGRGADERQQAEVRRLIETGRRITEGHTAAA
jgi:hypothetical protein